MVDNVTIRIGAVDDTAGVIAGVTYRSRSLQDQLDQLATTAAAASESLNVYGTSAVAATAHIAEAEAVVKSFTRALEQQLAVERQLGARAATSTAEQTAQLQTRLSIMAAETLAQRRAFQDAQTLAQEQRKFSEQISPRSSVAGHTRDDQSALRAKQSLERDIFDNETRGYERQAAASATAASAMIANLKRYQAEEEIADRERARFAEQMAPSSSVKFKNTSQGLRAMSAEFKEAEHSGNLFARMFRHVIALIDESARGQRGAMISSVGAMFRERMGGLDRTAIMIGGSFAAMAIAEEIIRRSAESYGELAQKSQTAAEAIGMSTEQYQRFAGVMEIVSGKADASVRVFGILSERIQTALSDPTSKASAAFISMGISSQQLSEGLKDPIGFLDLLGQKFREMGASMERTEIFRAAVGRGWQEMVPYWRQNTDHLHDLTGAVDATGTVMDEKMRDSFEKAAESSRKFTLALRGMWEAITELASSTGFTDWLTSVAENVKNIAKEFEKVHDAAKNMPDLSDKQKERGAVVGGISEGIMGRPGEGQYILTENGPVMLSPPGALPQPSPTMVPGGASEETLKALIMHFESGGRNVPNYRYDAGHTAGGYFQITDQTWKQFAPGAGVDLTQFSKAMQAPFDVQSAVTSKILESPGGLSRWTKYDRPLAQSLDTSSGVPSTAPDQYPALHADTALGFQQGAEKEMSVRIKAAEEATRLREAQLQRDADMAGKDSALVASLEAKKAESAKVGAAQVYQIQQQYVDRAKELNMEELGNKLSEGNQLQVNAIATEGEAAKAKEEAERQAYEVFKASKEEELAATHGNTTKQIAIVNDWLSQVVGIYHQGSEEYKRVEREKVEITREATQQQLAVMADQQKQSDAVAGRMTSFVKGQATAGNISPFEEIKLEQQIMDGKWAIDLAYYQKRHDLAEGNAKDQAQIDNEAFVAYQSYMEKRNQLEVEAVQKTKAMFESIIQPITGGLASIAEAALENRNQKGEMQRVEHSAVDSVINKAIGGLVDKLNDKLASTLTKMLPDSIQKFLGVGGPDQADKTSTPIVAQIKASSDSIVQAITSGHGASGVPAAGPNGAPGTSGGGASADTTDVFGNVEGSPDWLGAADEDQAASAVNAAALGSNLSTGMAEAGAGASSVGGLASSAAGLGSSVQGLMGVGTNGAGNGPSQLSSPNPLTSVLGSLPMIGSLFKAGSGISSLAGSLFGGGASGAFDAAGAATAIGSEGAVDAFGGAAAGTAAAGGGGLFSLLGSMLPLLALSRGGIIPSAAGGVVIPGSALGGGGTPVIAHPNEMVLPAYLSQGFQSMLGHAGTTEGNTASAPAGPMLQMHFNGPGDAAGIARWFSANKEGLSKAMSANSRNFDPSMAYSR